MAGDAEMFPGGELLGFFLLLYGLCEAEWCGGSRLDVHRLGVERHWKVAAHKSVSRPPVKFPLFFDACWMVFNFRCVQKWNALTQSDWSRDKELLFLTEANTDSAHFMWFEAKLANSSFCFCAVIFSMSRNLSCGVRALWRWNTNFQLPNLAFTMLCSSVYWY